MAMSNVVADKTFKTKKELTAHVRQLLKQYEYGDKIKGKDDVFMRCLINKHAKSEEKIGCGIKEIVVRKSRKNHLDKVVYIIRIDGSETDISWTKCITNPPPSSQVKDAARCLIRSQIDDFKKQCFAGNDTVICPITKIEIDKYLCAIDHCYPETFDRIFEDWCASENVDVKEIQTVDIIDTLDKTFANNILQNSWVIFHQDHCHLQAVHYKANLSLGSGPAKAIDIHLEVLNEDDFYENYRERDWGL
tara:strand:+ start:141 stop:884 length:744 start_codon:yes stop_codon:yes gene_type:complete